MQALRTGYPSIDRPWMKYYDEAICVNPTFKGTIYELIRSSNSNRMDNTCISFMGKRITYREVFKRINQVSNALRANGIKERDTVSICLPTVPEAIYLIFACSKIGAISNLIDPRINPSRIVESINSAQSKMVFFSDVFEDKFVTLSDELCVKNIVQIDPTESADIFHKTIYKLKNGRRTHFGTWRDFWGGENSKDTGSCEYIPNQVAAIVYSSGTTGVSKGVMLSNEGICYVAVHAKDMGPDLLEKDTFLNIMPPFLAYGLVCGICSTMYIGANLILIPKFDPKDFLKLVSKYKPNHTMGVPNFFSGYISGGDNKYIKSDYIKYSIVGGDKMNPGFEKDINEVLKKIGAKYPITKGYGMTELSSCAIISVPNVCNKVGSCGIPMRDIIAKVVDPKSLDELSYNVTGELYISSPAIMLGYLNHQEENNKVIFIDDDGIKWIKTGDLARIDEDGNVFIEGRIKRMIIRPDGHNVFPGIIEEALLNTKMVSESAVVGMTSPEIINGKIPVAFVKLNNNSVQGETMIRVIESKLLAVLPPRDVPMKYILVDEIPHTLNGKIDYLKLERMAEREL